MVCCLSVWDGQFPDNGALSYAGMPFIEKQSIAFRYMMQLSVTASVCSPKSNSHGIAVVHPAVSEYRAGLIDAWSAEPCKAAWHCSGSLARLGSSWVADAEGPFRQHGTGHSMTRSPCEGLGLARK